MAKVTKINHVTLIVDQLERAAEFYEKELGLAVVPAFIFDYPTAFFDIGEGQQLLLTEWEDA
jgi:catechol 2,3-dioxygenase-like lactoylglutathione lyase family enzyme